jgi:hypothetical protein
MSQRNSGYDRKPHDLYETPEWVTRAVLPYIGDPTTVWEPACGNGKITNILKEHHHVSETDITRGQNFFDYIEGSANVILTNPPYNLATEFAEHALNLMKPNEGKVIFLLRTDFDHAKSRKHLFANNPAFTKKLILTKRIVWFENEGKKAQPSFNHAWFIWDWKNKEAPTLDWYFDK